MRHAHALRLYKYECTLYMCTGILHTHACVYVYKWNQQSRMLLCLTFINICMQYIRVCTRVHIKHILEHACECITGKSTCKCSCPLHAMRISLSLSFSLSIYIYVYMYIYMYVYEISTCECCCSLQSMRVCISTILRLAASLSFSSRSTCSTFSFISTSNLSTYLTRYMCTHTYVYVYTYICICVHVHMYLCTNSPSYSLSIYPPI